MIRHFAALVVASLAVVAPARTQVVDLSTLTCKEFLVAGKESVGMVMLWFDGYFTGEDDPVVIDFEQLKRQGEQVGAYCSDHPDATMLSAAEKVMTADQPGVAQSR